MPSKTESYYNIQLPDGGNYRWSDSQFQEKGDRLYQKYPDVQVSHVTAAKPDTEFEDDDEFGITLSSGKEYRWNAEQYRQKGGALREKYPDARITRITDVNLQRDRSFRRQYEYARSQASDPSIPEDQRAQYKAFLDTNTARYGDVIGRIGETPEEEMLPGIIPMESGPQETEATAPRTESVQGAAAGGGSRSGSEQQPLVQGAEPEGREKKSWIRRDFNFNLGSLGTMFNETMRSTARMLTGGIDDTVLKDAREEFERRLSSNEPTFQYNNENEGALLPQDWRKTAAERDQKKHDRAVNRIINAYREEALKKGADPIEYTKEKLSRKSGLPEKIEEKSSELIQENEPSKMGGLAAMGLTTAASIGLAATGNTGAAATVANATLAMFAATGAGASIEQAKQAGATDDQAYAAGIASGAIMYGFAKLPIGKFIKNVTPKAVTSAVGGIVGKAGKGAVTSEMDKLLSDAAKRGIVTPGYAKEYLSQFAGSWGKNIAHSTGSFAAMSGISALVPLIYEDPDEYPVLASVLQSALKGAEDGFIMGAFAGGMSSALEYRNRMNYWKSRGKVTLAEVQPGAEDMLAMYDRKLGKWVPVMEGYTPNGEMHMGEIVGTTGDIPAGETVMGMSNAGVSRQSRAVAVRMDDGNIYVVKPEAVKASRTFKVGKKYDATSGDADFQEQDFRDAYTESGYDKGESAQSSGDPAAMAEARRETDYAERKAETERRKTGTVSETTQLDLERAEQTRQGRRDVLRQQMEERLGEFYVRNSDGDPVAWPARITDADGNEKNVYIVAWGHEGLAYVDAEGKKGTASRDQVIEQDTMFLDDHLDSLLAEQDRTADEERMAAELADNLAKVQQTFDAIVHRVNYDEQGRISHGKFDIGTPESPVTGTVVQIDPTLEGGAYFRVEGEAEPRFLSWERIAQKLDMNLQPKSSEQMVTDRINNENRVGDYNAKIRMGAELTVPNEFSNGNDVYRFVRAETNEDGDVVIIARTADGEVELMPESVSNLTSVMGEDVPSSDTGGNPVPTTTSTEEPVQVYTDPVANQLGIDPKYATPTESGSVVVNGGQLWADDPAKWVEWNDANPNRSVDSRQYLEVKLQEAERLASDAEASLKMEALNSQDPNKMESLTEARDRAVQRRDTISGLLEKYETAEEKATSGGISIDGQEYGPAIEVQQHKRGAVEIRTKTETKDGITKTTVVGIRNGGEVSMPTAHMPMPEGLQIKPEYQEGILIDEDGNPTGTQLLGVHEIREGERGIAAKIVVKDDAGVTTYDVALERVAPMPTESAPSPRTPAQTYADILSDANLPTPEEKVGFIEGKINRARKALEKAQKTADKVKPENFDSSAEYRAAKDAELAKVQPLQAELDHWSAVREEALRPAEPAPAPAVETPAAPVAEAPVQAPAVEAAPAPVGTPAAQPVAETPAPAAPAQSPTPNADKIMSMAGATPEEIAMANTDTRLQDIRRRNTGDIAETRRIELMREKAQALQQMYDEVGEDAIVSTREDILGRMRKDGAERGDIEKIESALEKSRKGGKRFRGFYLGGRVYVIADDIKSAMDGRTTYDHEDKHREDASTGAHFDALNTGVSYEELEGAVRKLSGVNMYNGKSAPELADEVLANAAEIARKGGVDAIPESLRKAGVKNEEFITFVKTNIENGRSRSGRLSESRRDVPGDVSDEGLRGQDGRDSQPQSQGVGGQGPRSDGSGGQGTRRGQLGPVISVADAAAADPSGIPLSITTEGDVQEKIRAFAKSEEGRNLGWTDEKIEEIIGETEDLIRAIHAAVTGDKYYDEWAKRLPTVKVDWRDGVEKPTVTWSRANIDYKYDMSADLLCINNEGLEEVLASPVMADLMLAMNRTTKEGFTSDDYLRLYSTLRDMGFVVPCKGCFDAAARLKMLPSVSRNFVKLVNQTIDERNADPERFDADLRALAGDEATIGGLPISAKNKDMAVRIGVAGDNLTEHMNWTQLMSAEGQTKALSDWGGIFRAWQRTGAGRPKDKLLPEPWSGEIVNGTTTIIGKYGEKTPSYRDILVNQGTGLRRNSHTEFRPLLAIDEIQMMREAYLRGLTVFKYMKELDDVRLFGKLGVKFNMSFFPAFVEGAPFAGLDKNGNYIAAEESVGGREFEYIGEDGKTHYDGMKGWEEAQKYVNKDVSLSSVIFSVPHLIKAMADVPTHRDPRGKWGSLIPFHPSGGTARSLEEQGLGKARAMGPGHKFEDEAFSDFGAGVVSFEQVQNDRFGEGWTVVDGKRAGTAVEPGHKLEFSSGTHYYNEGLGLHLFSSFFIYDNELKPEHYDKSGKIIPSKAKAAGHDYTIDYNDKVRELGTDAAYEEAATYYNDFLKDHGLLPRFEFKLPGEIFSWIVDEINKKADTKIDPYDPKIGWKGPGHPWSPNDGEAYYALWCDYGMIDPETGHIAPHNPVGVIKEDGSRVFELPDNTVGIIKDGVERYSARRSREESRTLEAIEEYAKRSVADGKLKQEDVDAILAGARESSAPLPEAPEASNPYEMEESQVRLSMVDDPELIDRLESEELVPRYQAVQVVDGEKYPPMAAMVEGKIVDPIRMKAWVKNDERPELAIPDVYKSGPKKGQQKTYKDGTPKFVFRLDKGFKDARGKKTNIDAAYNPYLHTSDKALNDQFSSAWARPNLAVMKVWVPKSELTSGYRAEKAKDAVGDLEWKNGPVANALAAAGKPPRIVTLTRYAKPDYVLEVDEVADMAAKEFEGVDVEVPFNTVTPALRDALVARGIKIGPPEKGNAGDAARPAYEEWLKEQGDSPRFSVVESDNFKNWFGDWQNDPENSSKVVDENGRPAVVYHGSTWNPLEEAPGEAVFDDSYRGTASGDNGFFGPGFYFTYGNGELSKAEARYYGPNVTEAYLNIRNPFLFNETLFEYNGARNAGDEKNSALLVNMVKNFPELVDRLFLETYNGNGELDGEVAIEDYVPLFEDVYRNKEFIVNENVDPTDSNIIEVCADPVTHREDINGREVEWSDYGFRMRMYRPGKNEDTRLAYAHYYLTDKQDVGREDHRETIFSIPGNIFNGIFESERFTDALKSRGYDGVMQSAHGDEVVAFYPNQIKSAVANNGEYSRENDDIRFSFADEDYMDAVEKGDTDSAQEMVDKAAEAAGYSIRGYHGTTHNFFVFDRSKGNPEGNWGKGFYFTNNLDDAEANYANENGPDLRNRVELLAEQMEWMDGYEGMDYDQRLAEAEKMLVGPDPHTISAAIRMENPLIIDPHYKSDETFFDFKDGYNEETDEYDGEQSGLLLDFVDAWNEELQEPEWEHNRGLDPYPILDDAYDGYTASQLETRAREILDTDGISDYNGDLASGEFLRAVFERMGFDGIIDRGVNFKFGTQRKYGRSMDGVDTGTDHIIAFKPNQIKQTDPVTYDDNGNVIPLSQRFNRRNDDIRFSFASTKEEFDDTLKEADASKGIVTSGLSSLTVAVNDIPLHDYSGISGDSVLKEYTKDKEFPIVDKHPDGFSFSISIDSLRKFVHDSAISKSIEGGATRNIHLSALQGIIDIIKDSIDAEIHPDYKKVDGSRIAENGYNKDVLMHRLYGAISVDGKDYLVKTTIKEHKDPGTKNKVYTYETTKIKPLSDSPDDVASNPSRHLNPPKRLIPVANLLNGVEKSYDSGKYLLEESEKTPLLSITNDMEEAYEDAYKRRDERQSAIDKVQKEGLSSLIGEDRVSGLLKDAYSAVPKDILSGVVDNALKGDLNLRRGFREYIRDLADAGLENDETGLLRAMINRIRTESGIEDLSDNDIRYMIWHEMSPANGESDVIGLGQDLARKRRWTEKGDDARLSISGNPGEFTEATRQARSAFSSGVEEAEQVKKTEAESLRKTLSPVLKAMRAQKRYDQSVVDGIVKFAREIMKAADIKTAPVSEVNRILGNIRNASARATSAGATRYANELLDVVLDHVVKQEKAAFEKVLHTKGKKLSKSGVEVVGTLDKSGLTILKTFRDKMGVPKEELANWIEERETAMSSAATDAEKAEARDEWRGGSLALDYLVDMDRLEGNRRAIEEELGKENAKPRGERSAELIAALEDNLRENRMDMVDVYRDYSARFANIVAGSKERVREFKEKQAERVEAIHRAANFDLAGISADSETRPKDFKAKLVNSPLVRLANMPLATFHDMLQIFGRRSVDGRGYLFNWLMPEAYEAEGNASRGLIEANDIMDAKVQELFGDEGMRWRDLYKLEDEVMDKIRENTGVDLSLVYKTPQSGQYARPLTVGNALYIYMVDKMSDGRMKLRKMGIEAEHVARLKQVIEDADPRMIQLVDWVQEKFFPDRRNKYNAVHEQIYGTPMAAIEDYVTLRVNKNERYEIKSAEVTGGNGNLTNITGSIIKRKVNTLPIDILNTDAFSLVQEHIQQMEEWAAYAQFREDLKALLSYKTFQNKASQMTTIYGSGDALFKNFEALCAIVAKQYNKAQSKVDAAAMSLAGGATSSAIAARLWTATKQFASFVTFFADASPAEMAKAMEHWKSSWKWNIENLPLQEKRWRGRNAGYDILDATKDERDIIPALTKARDWFGNWSMIPNAFVDFATTSMGSKATYETKIKQYLDAGFSEEAADRKAKFDAQEAVNTTQQSASPAHLSELQAQRTFLSSLATMFRNGPFGFTRRYVQAVNQAGKYFGGEDKRAQIIDFEKRRAMGDGLNEEQARDYAESKYEKGKWKAALNMIVMGYLAPLFWNLMGDMPYLAFGDDEKLKKKKLKSDFGKALLGPLEGLLFGGNLVSSFWDLAVENKAIRNSIFASSPMLTDVDNIVRNIGSNNVRALNDLIVLASKTALGVNPQTLTDGVAAVIETFHNDLGAAEEFMFFMMRIMNVPQSQLDDLWIDELQMSGRNARGRSVTELAEIYANYKLNRETPFTNYLYSKEEREERVENKAKTLKSKAKQRKEDNKKKSKK